MIPPLDRRGLLPPGVHECSWEQARNWSGADSWRGTIWAGLEIVRPALRQLFQPPTSLPRIVLGGSYFSDKPNPDDIEVTVVLEPGSPAALIGDVVAHYHQYHSDYKATHRVDFYPILPGPGLSDFRAFFQYVGVKTATTKGLDPKDARGVIQVASW